MKSDKKTNEKIQTPLKEQKQKAKRKSESKDRNERTKEE